MEAPLTPQTRRLLVINGICANARQLENCHALHGAGERRRCCNACNHSDSLPMEVLPEAKTWCMDREHWRKCTIMIHSLLTHSGRQHLPSVVNPYLTGGFIQNATYRLGSQTVRAQV